MKRLFLCIFIFLAMNTSLQAAVSGSDSTHIEIHGENLGKNIVLSKNSSSTITFIAYGIHGFTNKFYLDNKYIGVAEKIGVHTYTYYNNLQKETGYKYDIKYDLPAANISEGNHSWFLKFDNGTSVITTQNFSFEIINQTIDKNACSHQSTTIYLECFSPKRWEKSTDSGVSWSNISCTKHQYTESNPSAGKVKYRALNGDNTYSDVVTITYVDAVPSTIQALPATSTKTVEESITLTADVVDDNYSYQWKKGGTDISGATGRTYTISSIKSSDAGDYTCYVSNGCNGVTTTTATLSVNKCAQTIDFPEIPVQTYSSGLTYTLPKTTNKGLTITYQSMNTSVATVSGNVLTIKAPGTAIISASQVGNADYLEATQVSRTLTVNKRNQVITFDELPEKTYEDLPFTLPQKTDEGLTISYTSTNTAVATVSGNTVTILKPGTTDIIASQAGDATHYAATEVSQTLTVKKAAQAITFGSLASKTYGDAPFELNNVTNKNLAITYTSSDASVASISGNMVTIRKPGTVTITASQPGNAYYLAAASVSQTLTIKKANQSINLAALESRPYGSADFALPAQTDKGQTITYVSSNTEVATINGNIVHITGAGTTEITATQEGNEYYNAAPTVSQTLTVTKAYQTINFPNLPSCVYGQEPILLNATVNSDVTIEYESSNPSIASINGNELTIHNAGQCYITASAAGNNNYYTATPVERTLIVSKAQANISFAPLEGEYIYGDSPIALIANSDAGQVSFTSSNPAKLLIAGTNAIIQGAGQFTITAMLTGDANHKPASVSQEITINKAALTITANNSSRLYGDDNPVFTYTFNGFVNGDTKADISAAVQVSSSATKLSPVGTYEIVPTASNDDNYTISCRKGVLTIEQAPLIISSSASREYGEKNPEFTFIYSGFKNNENSNVLTSVPQAYTTAKKTSPVGTYPVYISGASAQNYSCSYEDGTLTITKAPLTITVQPASREYGENNPEFSFAYSGFKNNENSDVLSTLPQATTTATQTSSVGTYSISAAGAEAQNYNAIYVDGILTITKAPLTISAKPSIREYGDENSTFEVQCTGLKNEESSDVLSVRPQITTTATPSSTVGTYPIYVSSADALNYAISYEEGVLTIIKAPLTIRALDATRKRLEENPQFQLSITGFKLGETKEVLEQLPTIQCDANANSPAGIYPIVLLNDGYATNYEYTLINGLLTVEKLQYTLTVLSQDQTMGTVTGSGVYEEESLVRIFATPKAGYYFTQWSDGNTNNPRDILLNTDMTFEAQFAACYMGCINESYLAIGGSGLGVMTTDDNSVWTYNSQYGAYGKKQGGGIGHLFTPILDMSDVVGATISFQHAHKFAGTPSSELTLWVTPNYKGSWTSSEWHQITIYPYTTNNDWNFVNVSINIPAEYVGQQTVFAFQYISTASVYSTWEIKNLNISADCRTMRYQLLVSCDSQKGTIEGESGIFEEGTIHTYYANPKQGYHFTCWNDGNIENPRAFVVNSDASYVALFAADISTAEDTVIVSTTSNSATITTPMVDAENVYSYRLAICQNGDTVCVLSLDAEGHLTGIDFHSAPARQIPKQSKDEAQTGGLNIPVSGLASGTTYHYTLDALDADDNIIERREGDFTTEGSQSIENTNAERMIPYAEKVMINGQILILRNGKTYTMQGQEVK